MLAYDSCLTGVLIPDKESRWVKGKCRGMLGSVSQRKSKSVFGFRWLAKLIPFLLCLSAAVDNLFLERWSIAYFSASKLFEQILVPHVRYLLIQVCCFGLGFSDFYMLVFLSFKPSFSFDWVMVIQRRFLLLLLTRLDPSLKFPVGESET